MLNKVISRPVLHELNPALVFGLLVASIVCISPDVLGDGDTFTHIAAGGWMLDHRAVLTADPFTSSFAGQPWRAHEWLAEVLLAGAYRLAGLSGVVLLTAGAAAAAFGLLARYIGARCGWRETMVLTAGALVCAIPSLLARPHLLALPLLVVWIAGLLEAREAGRTPPLWLLLVMLVWANLHGGFAFGLALAGVFAVEATIVEPGRRMRDVGRWWAFLAMAAGVAIATPQGWDGLLFPFRLLQLRSLAGVIEWQPVDFGSAWGFELVMLGLVTVLGLGMVKIAPFRVLVMVGLLHMALAHSRHGILFGIVAAALLAKPVGCAFAGPSFVMRRSSRRWVFEVGFAVVALMRLTLPVAMADSGTTPVSAVAQLPAEVAAQPVLNSYHFGGYLALVGLHPFVDGRAELFGDTFLTEFGALAADGQRLRLGITRERFGWALLAVGDPLVAAFDRLEGWRRQYEDRVAVVFVRSSAAAPALSREQMSARR